MGLVALPGGKAEAPPAPSGLLKATREEWAGFWASPLASLVVPADLPGLRRLFTLYDERLRAYQGFRKDRLVPGSMGQPVLNPLFAAMKGIDAEVRQLEDRFGLSPIARLRLGIALGEAARSLESLNEELAADDDDDPRADPAWQPATVVTADARPAGVPLD